MAFVQVADNAGPISGITTTVALTGVAGGNLLVLAVKMASNSRSISTVVDSSLDVWTAINNVASNAQRIAFWYKANATAGTHTLTITFDSAAQTAAFAVLAEYSGITTTPLDTQGTATSGGTQVATLTVTASTGTAQANETVVSFATSETASRPLTTPTGYTQRWTGSTDRIKLADKQVTATETSSAAWAVTGGNSYEAALIVTFKESAAGGAGPRISVLVEGSAVSSLVNAGLAR
jgi:hypothetical protein